MSDRVPSYRHHRQSGQAIVTLPDGFGRRRDVLLGRHGSPESQAEYARVIREWSANGRRPPPDRKSTSDITVNELLVRFWRHAEVHYRHADGSPTSELDEYRYSLRPVRELFGPTPAAEFGPLRLKAVREAMVGAGLCRPVVNRRAARVRRAFKWAVGEELVPPSVFQAMDAVAGLKLGRTTAPEPPPVTPVPDADVDAVLPHVLPPVRAMIDLQRLTGMRPGEVVVMRVVDVTMTGQVWEYRPSHHKLAWRGRDRVVALGPRAQAVIRPFLAAAGNGYLFSPARAMAVRAAERRAKRRTPIQPSQMNRRNKAPKKSPGEHYSTASYNRAIAAACRKAGVPTWGPNRLRHTHATKVRGRYGLEAAQVTLGHSRADVTQIYAERDQALATRVALETG